MTGRLQSSIRICLRLGLWKPCQWLMRCATRAWRAGRLYSGTIGVTEVGFALTVFVWPLWPMYF